MPTFWAEDRMRSTGAPWRCTHALGRARRRWSAPGPHMWRSTAGIRPSDSHLRSESYSICVCGSTHTCTCVGAAGGPKQSCAPVARLAILPLMDRENHDPGSQEKRCLTRRIAVLRLLAQLNIACLAAGVLLRSELKESMKRKLIFL
eukprot:scaffold22423_cov120-Isochrysis_galbana.AAC.4